MFIDKNCLESPLDPARKWFNSPLVALAEAMFRARFAPPKRRSPAVSGWRVAHDPGERLRLRRMDDERAALKAKIIAERSSNGDLTPECAAFVECCVRQIAENIAAWAKRNRSAWGRNLAKGTTPQQVRDALGVAATPGRPMAHEDPEELRKAAVELGIWNGGLAE